MQNKAASSKSKLYCNRCGNFDLMKLNRGFVSRVIFDEPRKLYCQSCDTKLTFQHIAANRPLTPPSVYAQADSTVQSKDKLGRSIYVTMDEYVSSDILSRKIASGACSGEGPWVVCCYVD